MSRHAEDRGDGRAASCPTRNADPLLDHARLCRQSRWTAWTAQEGARRSAFTAEFEVDDLVYAALVTAPSPKEESPRSIASEARAVPGVLAVITYENMPRMKAPPLVDLTDWEGHGGERPADHARRLESLGWRTVAVVVAETLEQAEHAASLVRR